MAKSWHYPRWRRIGMQAGMWAILGATVGIAALVNHEVRQSLNITLAAEEQFGTVVAQLPRDWTITPGSGDEPGVVVRAKELGEGAREVTIRRQRVEALISPEEFLLRDRIFEVVREGTLQIMPSPIADRPGIVAAGQLEGPLRDGVREPRKLVRVCTILPSRHALVVEVAGPGIISDADVALAQKVAAAMQVTGEAWPEEDVHTVELPGGIVAGVPDGFRPVVELDPNRISRSMVLSDENGQWASVELIPCVFFSSDSPENMLRTMLLPHGTHWQQARVLPEGTGIWRIEPTQYEPFPRKAYLMSRPNGQAMLAVFRVGLDNEGLIAPAWSHIKSTASIPSSTGFTPLIEAGVAEADRLHALGLAGSISTREKQWWLWYQDSAETYLGETRIELDHHDTWKVKLESKWALTSGAEAILIHNFESDSPMQNYQSHLQRVDNEDRPGRTYVRVFDRQLTLEKNKIRANLTYDRPLRPWEQKKPAAFVPGGWLELIMGSLAGDSIILRTDTLAGCETFAPLEPMTVLIRPSEPGELPQEARTQWPVCLNVQINGSSEVMRWHFSNDDQLQQIDFAGGVHRIRSDEQTVTSFSREAAP